jgi:hypothetical protein
MYTHKHKEIFTKRMIGAHSRARGAQKERETQTQPNGHEKRLKAHGMRFFSKNLHIKKTASFKGS